MKPQMGSAAWLTSVCLLLTPLAPAAQEHAPAAYSNIGLKLNLGLGSKDFTAGQDLEKGGAAALALGYGVSQRVTLWLGLEASGHRQKGNVTDDQDHAILGMELGLQYKLRPYKRLQPFGKLSLGSYFRVNEEAKTILQGGGVAWALGAEYHLVRFLTIGAELYWKDYDYTQWSYDGGDYSPLPEPLPGNTRGLLINFTLH